MIGPSGGVFSLVKVSRDSYYCGWVGVGGYFGLSFVSVCRRLKGLVSVSALWVGAGPSRPSLRQAFRHGIGPRAPHPEWNIHNVLHLFSESVDGPAPARRR